MLKVWLRSYLGIEQMGSSLSLYHAASTRAINRVESDVKDLKHNISVTNRSIGILIAKADVMYAKSEDDPKRVAESAELGDQVIKRLHAEQAVREKYGHAPKED